MSPQIAGGYMRSVKFLASMILGLIVSVGASAQMAPNTILASGSARLFAKPDVANIDIGVITSAATTSPALYANSAKMAKVVAAIRALGVPNTDIKTSDFSVQALHPMGRQGMADESKTTGYDVLNKISVTVNDFSNVGEIIDAAAQAGANLTNSISFDLKDRAAVDDQALADAIRDARHKAEVMAAAENEKVGKMIAATNTPSGIPMNGLPENEVVVTAARRQTLVLPGQIEIDESVAVTFAIE